MANTRHFEGALTGQIEYRGISHPRAIDRFVAKWIGRWLESHSQPARIFATAPDGPRFHVSFEREGEGHAVGCVVRVVTGSVTWVGTHYGQDFASALKLALNRMVPKFEPTKLLPPQHHTTEEQKGFRARQRSL